MQDNGDSPRSLPALAAAFADMTAARTAPEAIRSMTFKTVKKGFDPNDVIAYLDRLAGDVELLHNRLRALEAEAVEAPRTETARAAATALPIAPTAGAWTAFDLPRPPETPATDEIGSRIAELMRAFDEDVRKAEQTAKEEAEAMIATARAEADEMIRATSVTRDAIVQDIRELREMLADALARVDEAVPDRPAIGQKPPERLVVVQDTSDEDAPEDAPIS